MYTLPGWGYAGPDLSTGPRACGHFVALTEVAICATDCALRSRIALRTIAPPPASAAKQQGLAGTPCRLVHHSPAQRPSDNPLLGQPARGGRCQCEMPVAPAAEVLRGFRPLLAQVDPAPAVLVIQASTKASSCQASYLPLRPPCPATISVFSWNGPPWPAARSLAIHLAGSR